MAGAATAVDRVEGQLQFSPPYGERIEAQVQLVRVPASGGEKLIDAFEVNHEYPYKFYRATPGGVQDPMKIQVSVKSPSDYVSYLRWFEKPAGTPFNEPVLIKRKTDAYVDILAEARQSPGTAPERIRYALVWTEPPNQRLELARRLAAVYAEQDSLIEQQRALADAVVDARAVGPKRAAVYWSERLDNLLLQLDYGNSRQPAKDFGDQLLDGQSAGLRRQWDKFVRQFAEAHPHSAVAPAASTAEALTLQLQAVNKALGRRID